MRRSAGTKYVTYQKVSSVHHRHQTGSGLWETRFQLNCWAKNNLDARTIAAAVKTSLDRYRGEMGDSGATVTVKGAFVEENAAEFNPPSDATQTGPHGESVDIVIWHKREE